MSQDPLILGPGAAVAPVGNIQEQLNTVIYPGLAVDNIYGPLTTAAVSNFQARAELPETGVVDPATWRRLFLGEPLSADVVAGDAEAESILAQAQRSIQINLGQRLLRLLQDGQTVATYPVAIGKPATPTPTGMYTIRNKELNPGGAFGTRWMGVTANGIGIHGTSAPSSIGLAVSNGCIRLYNQDVEALYNQVNVGDRVEIIGGAAAPGAGVNYTVSPGDTLYSIARRFNTTVAAIQAANNLTGDAIGVGQVLFIPGPTTGGTPSTYTVMPGDTLFGIARRFGTTVSSLQAANNLAGTAISPGQVLRIPTAPYAPPAPPVPPSPPPAPGPGTTTYLVQPGDTLFGIAERFGTTLAVLRQLNNLTGDQIFAGQTLIVPAPPAAAPIPAVPPEAPTPPVAPPTAPPPPAVPSPAPILPVFPTTGSTEPAVEQVETYVVQAGDTLFTIAERFGTTITELARLNALTTSEVRPGQVLRVR